MDSYALLEATHEVMVTTVKDSQPHTCTCAPHSSDLSCANSCCSQSKSSCDEHILQEKKFERGSTITYANLLQINLKTSYQKVDKTKIKKKAHVKCF
jgi:hypothetical protein